MNSPNSSLVPSTRRPLPLRARRDLTAEPIAYQGVTHWVVKDPVALEYFRLQQEQYRLLQLLDGRRSLDAIRRELQREFPTLRPTLAELQGLIADLHGKRLVYSDRPGQAVPLIKEARARRRRAVGRALRSVLYVKLPGWDPEPLLKRLYPLASWMLSPWAVLAGVLLVLCSWGLLGTRFAEFQRRLPEFHQFFGWPNLLWLWVTMGAAKLVHELAHGLTCRHYRGECHEIGVAFLVLSPCLYCDVSDSWVLADKWKRIRIAAAGMFIEVVIAAAALLAWWHTRPGMLHHLCLNVFFVTTITTVIFNANPLLRFDGYYILSDWLEIPNLRLKADALLQRSFARQCLGIETPPDPFMPQRGRAWFVLYSIASALYRWFLVFSILFALYWMLKPYGLQNLGLGMGIGAGLAILASMLHGVYRIVTAPRSRPMSWLRVSVSSLVVGGLAAAGLAVPLPLRLESPAVVEPHRVHHVYTSTPGRLVEVSVRPGERVVQGQVLARLANFVKEDHCERLRMARDVQKVEVAVQRMLDDFGREQLAQAALTSLEEQLADYEAQLRQLTIVAPCDGVVVAPPKTPEGRRREGRLGRWSGTPLDPRNPGSHLEPRTHLLSIAPDETFQAVVLIDQADRADLDAGGEVALKFDHSPGRTYRGRIEEVSERHVEFAPQALSNKFGGPLPTLTDRDGRERLTSAAYQAIVRVTEDTELFQSGVRGRARFTVETRTAAEWAWRWLKTTFHFRM